MRIFTIGTIVSALFLVPSQGQRDIMQLLRSTALSLSGQSADPLVPYQTKRRYGGLYTYCTYVGLELLRDPCGHD